MGLEAWMLVEDQEPELGKNYPGDDNKAAKQQALLTPYELGPFRLSHRL